MIISVRRAQRILAGIACCVAVVIPGCNTREGGYTAAAAIAQNGFARDRKHILKYNSQVVKLWGYVDHHNVYATGGEHILGEWWAGAGPAPDYWQFNLKGRPQDRAGNSIPVQVWNDGRRDSLLRLFAADASAERPTRVFVRGRLETFDAPTNIRNLTGLILHVESSADIRLTLQPVATP